MAESNLARLRVDGLRRTEKQLLAEMARVQQRIDSAPMVEQSISSLQRDFELERENHKQLVEKHATAAVSEKIARSRGNERFSVLSPASLPDRPESPNRGRILLLGVGFGVLMGAALAFGRECIDSSIRDSRTVQNEFGVPVLAEIPRIPAGG